MPGEVHVTAHFVAKPDQVEALSQLLHGLLDPTRSEAGCLQYDLWRSQESPGEFILIERWTDRATLDTHLAAPHLMDAKARLGALLAEPLEIKRWDFAG